MEKRLQREEWSNDTIDELIKGMRSEGLVFRTVTFQYQTKSKSVYISATGREFLKPSDKYYDTIEDQLIHTYNAIFTRFINFAQCQVDLTISVNEQGKFNYEEMKMAMHVTVPKVDTAEEALRRPLKKFLPFLENITSIQASGLRYELKAMHCLLELSEEDFNIVLEDPSIIHPKAKLDWLSFGSWLFMKAKETHSFDQRIPCFSGELLWDNKDVTIKHKIVRF